MKVEFRYVEVYEAFDNREWGASWGVYTTKTEAEEVMQKCETKFTRGAIQKKRIKVPISLDI